MILFSKAGVIETIVRGVWVRRGRLLLCRGRGQVISYLPWGHIECGEGATVALAREVLEELGAQARVGRFLGCCEHRFVQQGTPRCEINLVFKMSIRSLSDTSDPPAREAWLTFFWQPLDQLADARLEPAVLCRAVPHWLKRPGFATWEE